MVIGIIVFIFFLFVLEQYMKDEKERDRKKQRLNLGRNWKIKDCKSFNWKKIILPLRHIR